ncbi:MAG TPA: hypothetical protein VNJ01_15325 [Bacteriovoracaceae bacterium]|nr:hypothetical protein [Bacteriovoracaceae bacterium]
MKTNFCLLLLVQALVACGPDRPLSNNKLETFSNIIVPTSVKVNREGVLERSSLEKLSFDGSSYVISKYSSQAALSYVARSPRATPVHVKFNGDVMGNEVLLKVIESK